MESIPAIEDKIPDKIMEQQEIPINLPQPVETKTDVVIEANERADDNGERTGSKFFNITLKNRKRSSIRAKERKIRQRRLFRRVLNPKDAFKVLHEIKNIKIDDFQVKSNPGGGFQAIVTVNNVQYEGIGNSKNSAKSNVCEKALRDFVIAKMNSKPSRTNSSENISSDAEMKDGEGDIEDDDVPIINLASFAIFKLFSEWESQGYEVPEFRQANGQNQFNVSDKQEKPKRKPSKQIGLPAGMETMHPATLLSMMKPDIRFVNLGPVNGGQKTSVTVDKINFIGTGRSKKIARKNAAASACNSLFNTNFQISD